MTIDEFCLGFLVTSIIGVLFVAWSCEQGRLRRVSRDAQTAAEVLSIVFGPIVMIFVMIFVAVKLFVPVFASICRGFRDLYREVRPAQPKLPRMIVNRGPR